MDLKRMHIEAGLLRARGKRNFTSQAAGDSEQDDSAPAGDDLDDIEDP
jgi:hypothetical protein